MGEFAIVVRGCGAASEGPKEIGVVGPITHATTTALRDYLRPLIETGPSRCPRLRLDLSCCTGIDVDGVLALSTMQQATRGRGGNLCVVRVPPLIARQIRQHNFDDLLVDSQPSAPCVGSDQ